MTTEVTASDPIRHIDDAEEAEAEEKTGDRLMPLPFDISFGPIADIAQNIMDVHAIIKDDITDKIDQSEKKVEAILMETLWGSIVDELLFAGNMPVLQDYLLKYGFLGGSSLEGREGTLLDRAHYLAVSVACVASIVLRGISQVYLCNNPLTGVFICAGLYVTDPQLLVYALVGTVCATLGASLLCLPASTEIVSGLTGYVTHIAIMNSAR